MGATRAEKEQEVSEIRALVAGSALVVVTHCQGLNMPKITALRAAARAVGGRFKVTKNILARLAVANTDFAGLASMFSGQTGILCSPDPVSAARVAFDFAKENQAFVILGGVLGGQDLDVRAVEALAKLPSMDALRSTLLGVLVAPATRLVGTLQAPGRDLACVLKAHVDKQS